MSWDWGSSGWVPPALVGQVADLVHHAAVVQMGAVEEPVGVGGRRLADPLVGVRSALRVVEVATKAAHTYAVAARAAGSSWSDVADELGVPPAGTDGVASSAGRRAFELLAGDRAGCTTRVVRWTCRSCGQQVTDHGPDELRIDEREVRHAWSCARRRAALQREGRA